MAHSELFETRAPPVEGAGVERGGLGFLDSFGEDNGTAERCYRSHSGSNVLQGLPFGGVPTVLAINVVLWMVLTHTHPSFIWNHLFYSETPNVSQASSTLDGSPEYLRTQRHSHSRSHHI